MILPLIFRCIIYCMKFLNQQVEIIWVNSNGHFSNKRKYFFNQYADANSKKSIRKSLLIRLMTNRYYIKSVNFELVFCNKIAEIFLFPRFLPRIWLWTGLSLSFSYSMALTVYLFLLLMLYQIALCSHVTTRFVSP